MLIKKAAALSICLLTTACVFNMPTPVNQITPTYVSTLNYEAFDCNKLTVEADSLARREAMLVAAQAQRIKSSDAQAFWTGTGQGDGMEAVELSRVRGEREAVSKARALKACPAL